MLVWPIDYLISQIEWKERGRRTGAVSPFIQRAPASYRSKPVANCIALSFKVMHCCILSSILSSYFHQARLEIKGKRENAVGRYKVQVQKDYSDNVFISSPSKFIN